ncbi:unnamed protein product [Closterium sp. NIES-53]
MIRWIRAVRRQLSARFSHDLLVLRLHSEQGGEFSSSLLEEFCGAEGIRQTFTLPASPQHNGIAERRIGLVMEVARTSIVHAAAPHFLWPFAVRYAAKQLNLWPRFSHPETSPTLRWTGEVGDASPFRVWGALLLVRDPPAGKLSPRTLCCVFLCFPTDAPGWQFYHPGSRRVSPPKTSPLTSLFVSTVSTLTAISPCLSRLLHWSLTPPPPVAPLPPHGPASLGVSHVDPSPLVEPVDVSSDTSGSAERGDPTSAATVTPRRSWGSPGGGASRACPTRAGGAGIPGAAQGAGGAAAVGAVAGRPGGGAGRAGAAGSGGAGPGGASAGVPGTRDTGAGGGTRGAGATGGASNGGHGVGSAGGTGTGGRADTGGTPRGTTGGTGVSGASRQESLSSLQLREWAVRWGSPGGGAGGSGSRGAVATRAGGSGGATIQPQPSALRRLLILPPAATKFLVAGTPPLLLFPPTDQSQTQLLPSSPLPTPAPHTEVSASRTACREPVTRASTPGP